MIQETKKILSDLKWYGLLNTLDLRMTEATAHSWGHVEFLSALVGDEKLYREQQRTRKRLQMAKFRQEATLEKVDYTLKRDLNRTQVQDLAQLQFLRPGTLKNVFLLGPTGVGKTFIATALGHHACRQGFTTSFYGMHVLIEQLTLSRTDGSFLRLRDKLIKVDLLILDDVGLKVLPPQTVQDLYDILEERYQKKSTLVTTQLPLSNWKEIIEDPLILEAILDRLVHPAILLEIKGDSCRRKKGLEQSIKV